MSGKHDHLQVQSLRLRRGAFRVEGVEDDGRLHLVYGDGGGCVLDVKGTAAAALIPLRGGIQVRTSWLDIPIHVNWALVTDAEQDLRVVAHPGSRWLGLVGTRTAWELLMDGVLPPSARLLPAMYAVDRDLRRRITTLVRCVASGGVSGALPAFAGEIATFQVPLYAVISRCPGRAFATKLQVFLRLQRVRRFMNAYCDRELDIETLARIANYSPCHFLRTFKMAYQETPHVYLVRQRLRRAELLLRSGDLAVTEVALATGFENRSAFSRRYRQHFGVTANEVRRPDLRRRLCDAAG